MKLKHNSNLKKAFQLTKKLSRMKGMEWLSSNRIKRILKGEDNGYFFEDKKGHVFHRQIRIGQNYISILDRLIKSKRTIKNLGGK